MKGQRADNVGRLETPSKQEAAMTITPRPILPSAVPPSGEGSPDDSGILGQDAHLCRENLKGENKDEG